jgi:ribosomal protein L2
LTAYLCESGKRPVRRKKKAKEKNPEEKEAGRKRIRKKKRPEGKITERKWGRKKKGSYAVVKVCKRKGLTVGKCVSLQD